MYTDTTEYSSYCESDPVIAQRDAQGSRSKYVAFWALLVLTGLVALLFYKAGYPRLAFGMVGAVLATSMFVAPQIGLYLYFGWQAFDSVLLPSVEAVFTPAKALSMLIILVYVCSIGRIRQRILASKSVIITMLIFAFIGILGAPFALAQKTALRYALQIVVQIILVIAAIHFLDNAKRIYFAFLCCFVGGLLCSIGVILFGETSAIYDRATLGEYANPVSTALAISLSLMCIAGLWVTRRNKYYYLFYIGGAVPLLYAMMQTGSRSPLIAVFFALSFGALFARGAGLLKKVMIPALAAIFIFATVHYILSLNVLVEQSQERLSMLASGILPGEGESAGRLSRRVIWTRALTSYLRSCPATGAGFGNGAAMAERDWGEYRDVHSSIIGPLVDSGPCGFFVWMFGWLLLFKKVRSIHDPRIGVVAMMFFTYIMFSLLVHTIHFSKWLWIPVTFCLLLIEQDRRNLLEQQSQRQAPLDSGDYSEPDLS